MFGIVDGFRTGKLEFAKFDHRTGEILVTGDGYRTSEAFVIGYGLRISEAFVTGKVDMCVVESCAVETYSVVWAAEAYSAVWAADHWSNAIVFAVGIDKLILNFVAGSTCCGIQLG